MSTWKPVDLEPVLSGDWQRPMPTIGLRNDDRGLFYPGKSHTVASETEAGKTWFALGACWDEMQAGHHVLYLDFEDDQGTIVDRLRTPQHHRREHSGDWRIREYFHYIRPEGPVNHNDLVETLHAFQPMTLAVADGTTEAMVLHSLNPLDNADVATFGAILVKPLMALGAASVCLDHVTKDRDGRGRYAIGAVHKLNGLSGAGYLLENHSPFGIGLKGRSDIKITKDRPGQLRVNGLRRDKSRMHSYGDLVLDSLNPTSVWLDVWPPKEFTDAATDSHAPRPETVMREVAELLEQKGQMAQRAIRGLVTGRAEVIAAAIALLAAEGYITKNTPHAFVKAYDPEA